MYGFCKLYLDGVAVEDRDHGAGKVGKGRTGRPQEAEQPETEGARDRRAWSPDHSGVPSKTQGT